MNNFNWDNESFSKYRDEIITLLKFKDYKILNLYLMPCGKDNSTGFNISLDGTYSENSFCSGIYLQICFAEDSFILFMMLINTTIIVKRNPPDNNFDNNWSVRKETIEKPIFKHYKFDGDILESIASDRPTSYQIAANFLSGTALINIGMMKIVYQEGNNIKLVTNLSQNFRRLITL